MPRKFPATLNLEIQHTLVMSEHVAHSAIFAHLQASQRIGLLKHPMPLQLLLHLAEHAVGSKRLAANDAAERLILIQRARAPAHFCVVDEARGQRNHLLRASAGTETALHTVPLVKLQLW